MVRGMWIVLAILSLAVAAFFGVLAIAARDFDYAVAAWFALICAISFGAGHQPFVRPRRRS